MGPNPACPLVVGRRQPSPLQTRAGPDPAVSHTPRSREVLPPEMQEHPGTDRKDTCYAPLPSPSKPWPVVFAVAAAAALAGSLGVIGADALWLVPLGSQVAHGHLPGSVAFATAPTSGLARRPGRGRAALLGRLARARRRAGARGLAGARRGGRRSARWPGGSGARPRPARSRSSCGIVLAGSLPAVVVTGFSLFSLALFPLLARAARSRGAAPSPRHLAGGAARRASGATCTAACSSGSGCSAPTSRSRAGGGIRGSRSGCSSRRSLRGA